MARRLVVLAAHPDDAELTLGGTIALLVEHGWDVTVVVFTTSEYTEATTALRRSAAERAASILGHRLEWIDGGLWNQVEDMKEYELVGKIDALLARLQPDVVVTHWEGDVHVDHVQLARATAAALRRCPADLYALPPSEHRSPAFTRFEATVYIDISKHEHNKIDALDAFDFAGGFQPFDTAALRALWRAAGAVVGFKSAERLRLVRQRGLASELVGSSVATVTGVAADAG